LPESIGSLSNLQDLYLLNNSLASLPESIQSLTNLEYLYLSNNKLTYLPESIQSLSNLNELYLSNNKLTNIPESISILTKIEDLELDESAYDINNLSMDCHTLILTSIKNNITNLPPILRTLYLKSNINVDMIKLPYGCDIIRFE
jgi:Leucine-rich repeat (LRR) protein